MPFNSANTMTPASVALDMLTGREYLRVSQDNSGRQRSVTEQHDDNARATAYHSITLGEPYTDNDKSASRYATKERDDFKRLISDLERDRFGADVLVFWENSRGSRKVSEWALLIELLEEKRVRVFITCDDRLYDPANAADRKVLQSSAIDSEQESIKTSMRNRRTSAAQAEQGRPNATAPHGYMPQYDDKTGKLINWVENPEESAVPKEVFRRLRAGQSMRSIARDLAEAGHVNRSGRPFTDEHLRTMALRPAYGGYRKHAPKSRGRSFNAQNVEATLYRAIWAPLVDEETFWAVRRIMLDPARRSTRNGRAKHVLTMTIKCDVCGGTLGASWEGASAYYFCRERRCVQINKPAIDALIIGSATCPGVILAYLASDKVYEDYAAASQDSGQLDGIRAELSRLRAERGEAENAEPESIAEARMFARMVETLGKKISKLEEEERRLTLPAVLTDLVKPGKDVAERWEAAPVEARREVARLLLSADWIGEVRIRRGRGVAAADRIHWHREPACDGCTAA